MSKKNFLMFLQELLTMVDKDNHYSVALAKNALTSVLAMAQVSRKVDGFTLRMMMRAEADFTRLVSYAEDFAGVPGDFQENEKKRNRLGQMLAPSC